MRVKHVYGLEDHEIEIWYRDTLLGSIYEIHHEMKKVSYTKEEFHDVLLPLLEDKTITHETLQIILRRLYGSRD